MSSTLKHFQPFVMAEERAARSVFVGNIPYEATEEQLKEIFCQAGPVVSFRLVYDRETGKPKGYGFCEYQDVETAQSAMRNLNNHDFNGRPLRVGVAAGEQTKDENRAMQQALGGPVTESPYGESMDPDKAPEAISKAVASLPPEQMFELMKQMKLCIQNNPNEARNMLLQNPQLAYALLQAQIVMKIVDPQVALAMLHRQSEQIPPIVPSGNGQALQNQSTGPPLPNDNRSATLSGPGPRPGLSTTPPIGFGVSASNIGTGDRRELPHHERQGIPIKDWQEFQPVFRRDLTFSSVDHLGVTQMDRTDAHSVDVHKINQVEGRERREVPPPDRRDPNFKGIVQSDASIKGMSPRPSELSADFNLKMAAGMRPLIGSGIIPRSDNTLMRGNAGPNGPRQVSPRQDTGPIGYKAPVRDIEPAVNPRVEVGPEVRDPRQAAEIRRTMINQGPASRVTMSAAGPSASASPASAHDQEKAALIMQVLQLSDEQISMLPVDQRQSILILKEQIARSASQGDG